MPNYSLDIAIAAGIDVRGTQLQRTAETLRDNILSRCMGLSIFPSHVAIHVCMQPWLYRRNSLNTA